MAVYSIINKSQLEGALRLDAEYYQPEKLNFLKILALKGKRKIKDEFIIVNEIFDPTRNILRDSTIVFDLPDIQNYLLEEKEPIKDISEIGSTKKTFQKGDVIISRLRPYLKEVTYVGFNGNLKLGSTEFIVLRKKRESFYYPQTLFAFLITDTVQTILTQSMGGAEHPRFKEETLLNLYLPSISQNLNEEIKNLVDKAYILHLDSKSTYSQAENLLLEELGLKDFKVEDDLSYIVNLSEVKSAHRADAEYFQPKYERIFDFIKCPVKKLGEITRFLNHAKQPPYIENGEIPIITQKHLGKAFLNLDVIKDPETKFTNDEWLKKNPSYKLRIGDVLYYSVGAYIGKTNIILDEIEATAASFITIIRSTEEVNPAYLTVVLNSIVGQLQSEKWQSATAQQYIYPKDIKNFKIPILPKLTQQKIADLVQKSHEARKKAKELLEKTKRKVGELIEK